MSYSQAQISPHKHKSTHKHFLAMWSLSKNVLTFYKNVLTF